MLPAFRLGLAASLLLLSSCGSDKANDQVGESRGASLIMVVIDTLRADHTSFHGYERATTPGLDRLAEEAVVFEHCLAPSSWTKPSVVSLFSGLYPARHAAHRELPAAAELDLLAEVLKREGYATAAFSGNPYVSPLYRLNQGFDSFWIGGGEDPKDYPDLTEILDAARGWLANRTDERFFLYLQLMNVHGPYRAPESFRERFRETPRSADESAPFAFQDELWTAVMERPLETRPLVEQAHVSELTALYDAAVAYTDQELTRFLDELRAQGMLDRSLLVITSDHGEELFEHGGFGHRETVYSELVDVPLIMRLPAGQDELADRSGRRVTTPVSLVDLPATVLDLLLGGVERHGDGVSLAPLVLGTGEPVEREWPLLVQLREGEDARAFALQEWPYRYIRIRADYAGRKDVTELYNIETDPAQLTDLSATESERVEAMRQRESEARQALRSVAGHDPDPSVDLDEAQLQRMQSLGYMGEKDEE